MLADQIKQALHAAAKTTLWAEHAPAQWQDFPLETPKKTEHGHFATNLAMRLAKPLKRAPIQIAQELAAAVDTSGVIEAVEVVNPGFINIRVSAPALRTVAALTLEQGADYGKTALGQGKKVQVEFVSANPTGPLSVGHGRLAAYGDSLARVLAAAGFDVQREFYVNDVGNQIEKLKGSIIKRIKQELGVVAELTEDDYQGEDVAYLSKLVLFNLFSAKRQSLDQNLCKTEQTEASIFEVFRDYFQNAECLSELLKIPEEDLDIITEAIDKFLEKYAPILKNNEQLAKQFIGVFDVIIPQIGIEYYHVTQKNVLEKFNVSFDHWFRESELYVKEDDGLDQVQRTLNKLRQSGDMYENEGAVWFASSKYLDEKDRVVQKSDGNKTYLMSDIAYIYNKLGVRKFDTAIHVWGADHHGYIDRIKSAGQALAFGPDQLEVIIVQLVSIKGERMSKRRGNIIYLDELIDDVGADATRFFFLTRPPGTHCDFDMDLARDKSENNPMYYLQYVHARICSIMEKAQEAGLAPDPVALDRIAEPVEMELLKLIADYPWELQGAAVAREPHRVINYLTAVAGKFHSFYHDHKVIQPEDEALSRARLALCGAVRTVFRNGLGMLGISAPEKM